jgi:hypothetical protein
MELPADRCAIIAPTNSTVNDHDHRGSFAQGRSPGRAGRRLAVLVPALSPNRFLGELLAPFPPTVLHLALLGGLVWYDLARAACMLQHGGGLPATRLSWEVLRRRSTRASA